MGRVKIRAQCPGTSKQTGERCKLPIVPFSDSPGVFKDGKGRCRFHGAGKAAIRAKIREAAERYMDGYSDSDSPIERYYRIRSYILSEKNYQRRMAHKFIKDHDLTPEEVAMQFPELVASKHGTPKTAPTKRRNPTNSTDRATAAEPIAYDLGEWDI